MQTIVSWIPFVLVATIAGMIAAPLLRRKIAFPRRPAPKRKVRRLRSVDSAKMDDELQDLLKRR